VDFRLPRSLASRYGCRRFRRSYNKKSVAKDVHEIVQHAIATADKDGKLAQLLSFNTVDYTVKTFYGRWLKEYVTPRLEATTKKRYELSFKTINESCGSLPLKEFSRAHLHGYIQSRTGKVSASTINKDIIACKKMFSYAFELGAVQVNALVRFPTLKIQQKARRIPTAEEFHALVDSIPDPAIAAMVAVMGETGLRRSEAINLRWEHVNLRTAKITVERTKGKRVRYVPLSSYAIQRLRALVRFVGQASVFCHQTTGKPWMSPDKVFRASRKKIGLEWVTFHTLRHMRGTRWIEYGADIETVKEGLGHLDIKTTDLYTKHVKDRVEQSLRDAQAAEKIAGEKREDKNGSK
jgi:integrase/recombinase XerD